MGFVGTSTGCTAPVYEYWFQGPGGTWTLGRPFSVDPSWSWNTMNLAPGSYNIHVWANEQGDSTAAFESYAAATAILTGCTSASLSPAAPFAQPGATIGYTATSTGCSNPQYEFWVGYPDGTWSVKQTWGGATFNWDTTGLATGSYLVHVWANQQGASTASWEAYGSSSVALGSCISAVLSPTNPSAAAGTAVALTAGSTGCGNPQYAYYVQYPSGTWYLARTWGPAGYSWSTAGLAPGTYTIHVWANNAGDPTATWEAYGSDTVTLTGCTAAMVTGSPLSPQVVGTPVTFTASSSTCPTPVYSFYIQYPDGTWHLGRSFGATTTWMWSTTSLPKGTYTVHVWANNQGADTSTFETYGSATYTLS
jgi:cell wall-associated protease